MGGLAILGGIVSLAELSHRTRLWIGALGAVVVALIVLHVLQRSAQEGTERSPAMRAAGRGAAVLTALLAATSFAFYIAYIPDFLQWPDFSAKLAVLAAAAYVGQLMIQLSTYLVGSEVDWAFIRGVNSVRWLLGLAAATALAGYSGLLGRTIARASSSFHPYMAHQLLERGVQLPYASVLATAAGGLAILLSAVVVTWLQRLSSWALGEGNLVAEWLDEHRLVARVRTPQVIECRVDLIVMAVYWHRGEVATCLAVRVRFLGTIPLLMKMRSDIGDGDYWAPRWSRKRLRAYEAPFSELEMHRLEQQIAEALSEAPRVGCTRSLDLVYRAAGGHEELTGWETVVDSDASPDPAIPSEYIYKRAETERTYEVATLPAAAALRRLRAGFYRTAQGAPFLIRLHIKYPDPDPDASPRIVGVFAYSRPVWPSCGPPAWIHPPGPHEYRADLRRFPIARVARPPWLVCALHDESHTDTADATAPQATT